MATKQGIPPTTHTVTPGDSLYGIAEAYYCNCRLWNEISMATGGIHPEQLTVGAQLRIPAQPRQAPLVRSHF